MAIHNSDIKELFKKTADLLEIKGANPFRIRAYRNAARTVGSLSEDISDLVQDEKDLTEFPNIGKDLAGKIKDIVKTGQFKTLENLKEEVPIQLSELMDVEGLGAKKAARLYKELDIKNPEDLRKAIESEKIRDLDGFGKKMEENIKEGLKNVSARKGRFKISRVEELAKPLIKYLKDSSSIKDIEAAGSYRRKKDTVGDLDILATVGDNSDIIKRFTEYEEVKKVISKGKKRTSIILENDFQVDLRVFSEESYGAAMLYFTGSKEHNIQLRKIAGKKDLKINEYGVFKDDDRRRAGKTEEEVYGSIDLPYIPPEIRENRGEIEAASSGNLPELVTLDDIRGDLHMHTKKTDGSYSIKEMAEACINLGYDYMAISEHTRHVTVAGGLGPDQMKEWMDEIDRANEDIKDIEILKSAEVDILEDGSLDLPDDILKRLDLTTCSIHYKFRLSKKKQTERILKAMDNPYFNILGHPSGRLINEREPYELDMEKILEKASGKNCFMELNAHPSRLDITDKYAKKAKEKEVRIAVSTDAHSTSDLKNMKYGLSQARRGWLEKGDILNALSYKEFKKALKK